MRNETRKPIWNFHEIIGATGNIQIIVRGGNNTSKSCFSIC